MRNILRLLLAAGVLILIARLEVYADDFESGIANWTAIQENSGDVINLSWEKLNTYGNSAGALRVVMRIPETQTRTVGNTGARYNCATIAANSRVRVSFNAKSLYGSPILNIARQVSDSASARVKLTPDWKSYTVDMDVASSTSYLVFSTVSVFDGADTQCVVSGEFILDNVAVSTVSEAYVLNPSFNGGISNWQGYRNAVADSSIIAYNSGNGPDGKSGYMNVNISTTALLYSHQTGAYCITNSIPANSRLQVTFWAKSVSGSNYLNVERMYGGGSRAQAVLSTAWKKYSLAFDVDYTTAGIIFNTVAVPGYSGFTNVTSGNFLIDDVHIDVVANSVSNYNFDSSITGWSGLRNGAADATILSRETADTWGGSAGALRVNISTAAPLTSCSSGATCTFSGTVKAYNRIKVSFWAKSVSGSPYLNIERTWSGARQQVTLTAGWNRYDVYLDLPYDTGDIVFNTVDAIGFSGFDHVVNGVFLLDNVIVSALPEESLTASFSYDRPAQYSNFTTVSTSAALNTALNSGTINYIYLPPGDYTVSNPIIINRNTPLFIHGGDRMGTRLIPSDNTKPMFIVRNAPLINITGLYLLGPAVTEYRSLVFQNFVPTIFEMHACFVDRAAVEIQGRGSFTFQGVYLTMRGYSQSSIIVDHPLADTFIIGGNIASSGAAPQSPAGGHFHIAQKQGRLRLFSTGFQGALGPADVKITSASTIGPHMIANVRTEGSATANTYPSTLLQVPATTDDVDVIVLNNSVNCARPAGEAIYVDYNGGGTLWLLGNNSTASAGKLVTGTAASGATVVALGNYLYTNINTLPVTGATLIFDGNIYNYKALTGDNTYPNARWVDPGVNLSGYSNVPPLPEVTVPAQIELPVVDTTLTGMINVKNSPYFAAGNGVTDDTAAIQSALNAGKLIYFPAGTYLVTSPLGYSHSVYGGVSKTAGGWIAGAGSGNTKILRRLTDKGSVFLSQGIAYFTIQGIAFETAAYDSGDPGTITVPCVTLEYQNFGHATQEVMYDDCKFTGGKYAAGIGLTSPNQCSEFMFVNCVFQNAKYGLATGGFNALANLACSSWFVNNEIATGACEDAGSYMAGTWALYHTTISGSYGRDFYPRGSASDVWYFHRVFSSSNKLYEQGGTGASYIHCFDHCEFTPVSPSSTFANFDAGGGALFNYTTLNPGSTNFGSGPMSVKFGLKLHSNIPSWNTDQNGMYITKKP